MKLQANRLSWRVSYFMVFRLHAWIGMGKTCALFTLMGIVSIGPGYSIRWCLNKVRSRVKYRGHFDFYKVLVDIYINSHIGQNLNCMVAVHSCATFNENPSVDDTTVLVKYVASHRLKLVYFNTKTLNIFQIKTS